MDSCLKLDILADYEKKKGFKEIRQGTSRTTYLCMVRARGAEGNWQSSGVSPTTYLPESHAGY